MRSVWREWWSKWGLRKDTEVRIGERRRGAEWVVMVEVVKVEISLGGGGG